MKKLTFLIALNFCSFIYCPNALASFENGNDLYTKLGDFKATPTVSIVAASAGVGYVVGIHDALDGILFCSPNVNLNKMQVVDIVYNYLRDNPQVRQKEGNIVVSAALKQAFPCPSKK